MKAGRPSFEITEDVIKKVEILAAQGLTHQQICSVLGICEATLYKKKNIYRDGGGYKKRKV